MITARFTGARAVRRAHAAGQARHAGVVWLSRRLNERRPHSPPAAARTAGTSSHHREMPVRPAGCAAFGPGLVGLLGPGDGADDGAPEGLDGLDADGPLGPAADRAVRA